jgi:hypothetical protein
MDEATVELLSRYLDDDLEGEERGRVERLLKEDDAARSELEGMRQLRRMMVELADREQPPAELDALLEPLRRTVPGPQLVRPTYRWLAAAASVLVAVGVAYQVARQSPAPPMPTSEAPVASPAPHLAQPSLPSQPRQRDARAEELVSATDRLLASPLPEPEVDRPPPLDVIGPLEAPRAEITQPAPAPPAARSVAAADDAAALERESESPPVRRRSQDLGQWAPEPDRETARSADHPTVAMEGAAAKSMRLSRSAVSSLEVVVNGDTLRVPVTRLPELEPGSFALLLEVVAGEIHACRPASDAIPDTERACRAVVGTAVGEIRDGSYRGWLHVPG